VATDLQRNQLLIWGIMRQKYEHERIISPATLARRGKTKYRSIVTPGGHVLRIAFPQGKRRTGSGELQAILHPIENPYREVEYEPVKIYNRIIEV